MAVDMVSKSSDNTPSTRFIFKSSSPKLLTYQLYMIQDESGDSLYFYIVIKSSENKSNQISPSIILSYFPSMSVTLRPSNFQKQLGIVVFMKSSFYHASDYFFC